ncbi:50S ribosomal protein L22 [Patescibacteria group bacterium]|nr:50S ribosomal protein L22 [Patescibacteria group bacterium]
MAKTSAKPNSQKQIKASVRQVRLSPRKARLVTNLVKNMYALDAIAQLQFVNKKAAPIVIDVIKSAVANGVNNFKIKKENLYVSSITCDAGPKLKRYMPRAQGRASEIRRPLSHINVVLVEMKGTAKKANLNLVELERKTPNEVKAEKDGSAKTAKQDVADEKSKQAIKSQSEKGEQDVKKNKVTQKRRLFNRKSGV